MSQDPLEYQNDIGIRIDDLMGAAHHYVGSLATALAALPAAAWDGYDDNAFQAALAQWLSAAKNFGGTANLPADEQMAKDLERAMWAAWMPRLSCGQIVQGGVVPDAYLGDKSGAVPGAGGAYLKDLYASIRGPIAARLGALNILNEAGVGIHWYQSSESEDKPLIDWASRFKLEPWAEGQ